MLVIYSYFIFRRIDNDLLIFCMIPYEDLQEMITNAHYFIEEELMVYKLVSEANENTNIGTEFLDQESDRSSV